MKKLIAALVLTFATIGCASTGSVNVGEIINPRYDTVKEEVAAAVGAAEAKLVIAQAAADLAEARLRSSALPDRVVDTIMPAVEKYRTAVEKAANQLDSVVESLQDLDAIMAPVINARLDLANIVRLHDVLSDLRAILEILEK